MSVTMIQVNFAGGAKTFSNQEAKILKNNYIDKLSNVGEQALDCLKGHSPGYYELKTYLEGHDLETLQALYLALKTTLTDMCSNEYRIRIVKCLLGAS